MDKLLELNQSPAIPTFQKGLTTGRPQICLVAWGPIPDDHDVPLRVGQTGFHLANDGIAAHEILIEGFEIEPGVWAGGAMISRIREKGDGFAFVSLRGIPGFAGYTEKWDLLRYMAAAAAKKPASQIPQIEYRVKVGAIYRDGFNVWYRSQADLIYIPTQNRLTFGPTGQQRCGTHPEGEAFSKLAECPPDNRRPAPAADAAKATDKVPCSAESVGHQINRHRGECRMTVEELAEAIAVTPRTVQRHMADVCRPHMRHLGGYEQVFSKLLNKNIVIKKMSSRCRVDVAVCRGLVKARQAMIES